MLANARDYLAVARHFRGGLTGDGDPRSLDLGGWIEDVRLAAGAHVRHGPPGLTSILAATCTVPTSQKGLPDPAGATEGSGIYLLPLPLVQTRWSSVPHRANLGRCARHRAQSRADTELAYPVRACTRDPGHKDVSRGGLRDDQWC